MDAAMPATLNEAIANEALWLQAWVALLVLANMLAVFFLVHKEEGQWRFRLECLAIIVGFIAAATVMDLLYSSVGYVRLLGLGHLVGWTAPYLWLLSKRKTIGHQSLFGKYVHFYLLIAGISLVIDGVDVVRYLLGDGELIASLFESQSYWSLL